jgi:hypothetical protein
MTTGTLILNIVMIAVAAALVAIPAVFIPHRLDRDIRVLDRDIQGLDRDIRARAAKPSAQPAREPEAERRWAPKGQRSADAA